MIELFRKKNRFSASMSMMANGMGIYAKKIEKTIYFFYIDG